MDKETFEKIEQKKAHFLLALEEFDGGTLDVDEMKEDYESLFRMIKEQQKEIDQLEKEVDDQNEAAYNLLVRNKAFKRQVKEQQEEIERLKATALTEEEFEIVKHWGFIVSTEKPLSQKDRDLYFKITE